MDDKIKRAFWQAPWGYKESIAVVGGLSFVGLMLQLSIGNFNFTLLEYPVGLLAIVGLIVLTGLMIWRHKSPFFVWFSGVPMSVSVIGGVLFFALIMGLVPQHGDGHAHEHSPLGFDTVTRSWPFVLLYSLLMLNLSMVTARRLLNFKWGDYAFYLNHLGLLLLLIAAGIGAADLRRYVMHVQEEATEWRVFSDSGDMIELPVAIHLKDFYMEEYIPKLAIIDKKTGETYPSGKPQMWQIDTLTTKGAIAAWNIEVLDYIHEAIRNSDSTYRHVPMPGSCPAVKVRVINASTGFDRTGWICGGNFAQLYMTMELNEHLNMVMTRPEPKLYRSEVIVYTQSEKAIPASIEVNKPLKVENWFIYQYSYDSDRGKASTTSSFELVYDPWLSWVYIGLWMFIAGSVLLIWEGNKKSKISKDDHLE
ncbi:MAG: cytochrome c biogenesis protein ResB [Paludibacter sp.]|jgi:hypothetical protein|nr:cytochrome c biogenesis protein ResB [Paludibacter sp.]